MEKHALFTREGGFVTYAVIPPFQPPVGVLIWGQRTFRLDNGRYVETLVYTVTETAEKP